MRHMDRLTKAILAGSVIALAGLPIAIYAPYESALMWLGLAMWGGGLGGILLAARNEMSS
jgi:hypothetical protein